MVSSCRGLCVLRGYRQINGRINYRTHCSCTSCNVIFPVLHVVYGLVDHAPRCPCCNGKVRTKSVLKPKAEPSYVVVLD